MANPPPPYDDITGISRTVMKDNAQETLVNYNGNARPGEIVVDLTTNPPTPYIGNNVGQLTLLTSAGTYGNAQVGQYLEAGQVGNIIPSGNAVYSLGNATNQWNDLYVSNATIFMNNVPLSLTAGNVLTVNGNAVLQNNSNTTISTTGNISAGNVSASGNVTGAYVKGNGSELTSLPAPVVTQDITSNGAMSIMLYDGNIKYVNYATVEPSSGNIAGGNITTTGLVSATGNVTGNYFIGNGSQLTGISSGIQSSIANGTSNVNIATANGNATITANAASTWTFGTDSTLTLPAGSSRITSYGQITIETDNNASGMYLNADGVNLLYANTNVTLRANSIGANKDWNFGSDGNLAIPGSIIGAATVAIDNRASGNGADIELYSADDILLQARDRSAGSTSEGGDINIFAGDSAEDSDSSGGDVIIEGGRGGAANVDFGGVGGFVTIQSGQGGNAIGANFSAQSGGDLTLRAGDAGTNNGNIDLGNSGGDVIINAGDSTGNGDPGGTIYLTSGAADASALAGDVVIQAGGTWTFDGSGNLNLPMGGVVYETNIPDGGLSGSAIALKPTGGTNADQELLIYPTVNDANHLHLTTGNLYNTELFLGDDNLYVKLANTGNVVVNSNDDTGNTAQWTFGTDGNLTLPGNTFAVNYANGTPVSIGGGSANTGNVTFNDQAVVGTGDQEGSSGLYLAPGTESVGNLQYIRVRGGDVATHIHLDTGNNAYFDQYFGDDGKYVKLVNTGNVEIGSNDAVGNSAQWTFDTGGNLTFPTGNLVITPVDAYLGNSAVIASQYHSLITLSTGANGGLSSFWVEDYANASTSNIAAVYANPTPGSKIVRIAVGTNGSPGPNLWDFGADGNLTAPGNVSAVGNITGAYILGNGSQLTDVTASVPGQTILPTVQTITVAARPAGLFGGGQGGANVTVANAIPVTEYGVIITDGTVSEKYKTGSLGSIPGTVSLTFTTGLNSAQFTVFAYVTSNAGTYYSNAATGTSGICLLAGTQIALSDGTRKAIEHITYTDKMLSWDFDRGCYAETTAVWIKRGETGSQYNLLTFSDGTTLRTFDQHRIFNKQAGAFTYPMTDATPIGTVTVNEHGQEITLTNKQVIVDTIEYYNVITDYHMNLFSDTVLTSCRFNNIYPITDMKFVKDGRKLRTRAEFENIPDRFFHGLRLAEQTTDIKTVEWYVNRLLSTEVLAASELTV